MRWRSARCGWWRRESANPDAFWRATPAELAALVGAVAGAVSEGAATPPEAGVLARLREEHPDG